MSSHWQHHVFWGKNSPLTTLGGAAILVIASGRISFALICSFSLIWVYVFTMLAVKLGGNFFPSLGRNAVLLFISSLSAGIFLILLWIFDPLLALESCFFIFLVPAIFTASGLCDSMAQYDILEALSQALVEALILGVLVLGISLIREPLGFGSISVPGLGLIRFIGEEPIRFFQVSAGAFIIMGYGNAIYRYFRNRYANMEEE